MRGFTHAIELLDTIPGVDQRGAEVIVAEIGIDMARFETAPRLAAWAGVAPGNDESAGKQRSGKTRKGNRSLQAVLTQLAHAAVRTKGHISQRFIVTWPHGVGSSGRSWRWRTRSCGASFICFPAMHPTANWGGLF